MKNLDEIKKLLEYHKPGLTEKYHIKNIGLFGSIVRGDITSASDVDILVEFEKPIGLDFVVLGDELEEILGVKVDLVTPNAIKPRMLKYVKQDLIYVFCGAYMQVVRFTLMKYTIYGQQCWS